MHLCNLASGVLPVGFPKKREARKHRTRGPVLHVTTWGREVRGPIRPDGPWCWPVPPVMCSRAARLPCSLGPRFLVEPAAVLMKEGGTFPPKSCGRSYEETS